MNKLLNSSPLFLRKNSFLDNTPSMNEKTQDEVSKSNQLFFVKEQPTGISRKNLSHCP